MLVKIPLGGSIDVVRNFPKLRGLNIGCCGVSDLSPLVKGPGLRGAGSWVYLVYSPLTDARPSLIPTRYEPGECAITPSGHLYKSEFRNEDGV